MRINVWALLNFVYRCIFTHTLVSILMINIIGFLPSLELQVNYLSMDMYHIYYIDMSPYVLYVSYRYVTLSRHFSYFVIMYDVVLT